MKMLTSREHPRPSYRVCYHNPPTLPCLAWRSGHFWPYQSVDVDRVSTAVSAQRATNPAPASPTRARSRAIA
jgi:hypothetical protein